MSLSSRAFLEKQEQNAPFAYLQACQIALDAINDDAYERALSGWRLDNMLRLSKSEPGREFGDYLTFIKGRENQ